MIVVLRRWTQIVFHSLQFQVIVMSVCLSHPQDEPPTSWTPNVSFSQTFEFKFCWVNNFCADFLIKDLFLGDHEKHRYLHHRLYIFVVLVSVAYKNPKAAALIWCIKTVTALRWQIKFSLSKTTLQCRTFQKDNIENNEETWFNCYSGGWIKSS